MFAKFKLYSAYVAKLGLVATLMYSSVSFAFITPHSCRFAIPTNCSSKCVGLKNVNGTGEVDLLGKTPSQLKVNDVINVGGVPHTILEIDKKDKDFILLTLEHGTH